MSKQLSWVTLFGFLGLMTACGGAQGGDDPMPTPNAGGAAGSGTGGSGAGIGGNTAGTNSGGMPNVAGAPPTDACTQTCIDNGFSSGNQAQGQCQCANPTDMACVQAMEAFCVCLAAKEPPPCTDQDRFNDYVACHTDRGGERAKLLCVGGYVQGTSVDCDAALSCF
jgi:hypothetical protein